MNRPQPHQYPNEAAFWAAYRLWQCQQAIRRG